MKLKKAMQEYSCWLCKGTISKGDKYARKSVLIGQQGIDYGGGVKNWEPYRESLPICEICAEK